MPDFLDIRDIPAKELTRIVDHGRKLKAKRAGLPRGTPDNPPLLDGHLAALIFEKPSTRTRMSFDAGIRQLGGQTIVISTDGLHLGQGHESVGDTAAVMSRYVDLIMIRTFSSSTLQELAHHSHVPVINGLTDESHPCQIMADIMTFEEKVGPIRGKTVAWMGSGNNVCATFLHAAGKFGFDMVISCPDDTRPCRSAVDFARSHGSDVDFASDPRKAVENVHLIVTDVWLSMHENGSGEKILDKFRKYQVNDELMACSGQDSIFMHCLPAHRGEEVTSSVLDGPQSVALDEAENRLHIQKSIMLWCLGLL